MRAWFHWHTGGHDFSHEDTKTRRVWCARDFRRRTACYVDVIAAAVESSIVHRPPLTSALICLWWLLATCHAFSTDVDQSESCQTDCPKSLAPYRSTYLALFLFLNLTCFRRAVGESTGCDGAPFFPPMLPFCAPIRLQKQSTQRHVIGGRQVPPRRGGAVLIASVLWFQDFPRTVLIGCFFPPHVRS